jgi:alkylhydroperoxidase family enzyme
MARLSYLDANELPEPARRVFESLEASRGFVPNLYRVAANAPHFLSAFAELVAVSRAESSLPASLKELAILQVAKLTGAATMWASHQTLAASAGVPALLAAALPDWRVSGTASPVQAAVLTLAEECTEAVRVTDHTWAEAANVLSAEQLAELVFVVAFYNMVARILHSFGVDLDPRYASSL